MTKARQTNKEAKKEPVLNLKEKRAVKKAKKEDAPLFSPINVSPAT